MFLFKNCFCQKKLLLEKKCWDFWYKNRLQAIWPWPQAAINPCMALATILSYVYMCDVGKTALHLACYKGEADCVRVLLEHGADFDKQHDDGEWLCVTGLLLKILS